MNGPPRAAYATTLVLLALLLGGCASGPRQRTETPVRTAHPSIPAVAAPAPREIDRPRKIPVLAVDFWQTLRASFVLGGCNDPLIGKWIRSYSEHPKRFQAQIRQDLPLLRVVADMAMEQQVPGEFAFLPWVESNFRALPAQGNRPAGMWQIMPGTGRALGLRIDAHYDGRLDLEESSASALKLLAQHYRVLGDWRLADMAYNTGLYRIKRMLRNNPDAALDRPIPELPVSNTTRNHLAKLSALACIVREPGRHGIHLPRTIHAYALERVSLSQPLELPIAARLADVPLARLRALNAAYLDMSVPATHLTLPRPAARRLASANAKLATLGWHDWQWVRLRHAQTFSTLAAGDPAQSGLLAAANGRQPTAQLASASTLWLPKSILAGMPEATEPVPQVGKSHRVRSGDTLWDIARHFHVSVGDLRFWNKLDTDLLHLGQILRLSPP